VDLAALWDVSDPFSVLNLQTDDARCVLVIDKYLSVPEELVKGAMMMKVSRKHRKQLSVSIDPDIEGPILYKS
jgi:hypothetical protein